MVGAYGLERPRHIGSRLGPPDGNAAGLFLGKRNSSRSSCVSLAPGCGWRRRRVLLSARKVSGAHRRAVPPPQGPDNPRFPSVRTCFFLIGVLLFGMGYFFADVLSLLRRGGSRKTGRWAFWHALGGCAAYAMHNLISACGFSAGQLGDRFPSATSSSGVCLGVVNHLNPCFSTGSLAVSSRRSPSSGVYIGRRGDAEKRRSPGILPRDSKSLGFGILACANLGW